MKIRLLLKWPKFLSSPLEWNAKINDFGKTLEENYRASICSKLIFARNRVLDSQVMATQAMHDTLSRLFELSSNDVILQFLFYIFNSSVYECSSFPGRII